jgi:hypothetical protein
MYVTLTTYTNFIRNFFMTSFRERLIHTIELLNKTQSTFAIEAGLSPSLIQMYVGKRASVPGHKTLERFFAAFPQINPEYLTSGHGAPLRPVSVNQSNNTGNVVGPVSGGTVSQTHYASVSDCERDLATALAEVKHLQNQLKDKETIIELLRNRGNV